MNNTAMRLMVLMLLGTSAGCGSAMDVFEGVQGVSGDDPKDDSLFVSEPAEGAVIEGGLVRVEGRAVGAETVEVNEVLVDVVGGVFSVGLPVTNGPFEVVVRANGSEVRRHLVVVGPHLEVTSPARGAFYEVGAQESLLVAGKAGGGVEKVRVNGADVSLGPDGQFSVGLPFVKGLNVVSVETVGGGDTILEDVRSVIYGEYAEWGEPASDALSGRISKEGLRMVSDALSENLGSEVLGQLGNPDAAAPANPDFQITSTELEAVTIGLVPQQDSIRATINLYGFAIGFSAQLEGMALKGDIEANPAEMSVNLHMDTDGSGGLSIYFSDAYLEMHDFDFDVRGLLGLFDWIIKGIVEDELEKALVEFLDTFIIEDVLTPEALQQEAEIMGKSASFALMLTEISVDPEGLSFSTDVGMEIAAVSGGPTAPGVYKTAGTPPSDSDHDAELRVSLADDFVNQLLANLWRGDLLNIDLSKLMAQLESGGEGGGLPFKFDVETMASIGGAEGLLALAPPETLVGVMIRMGLPPLVEMNSADESLLTLTAGEMIFEFTLDVDGVETVWARVATHLSAKVEMDAESPIGVAIGIDAKADVLETPLFEIKESSLENMLTSILGLVPAIIAGGGVGDAVQMGDASQINPGLALGEMFVDGDGVNGDFLSFYIFLINDLTPQEAPELEVLSTETSPINGHTYALLSASSWSDAQAFAEKAGGHLATVRSRDENDWIVDTFGRFDGQTRDMWIGLTDKGHEGEFRWVSGEPMEWSRWSRDSPDNGIEDDESSFGEDFVFIYGDRSPRQDERWNDYKNLPIAPWNSGFHGVVEVVR